MVKSIHWNLPMNKPVDKSLNYLILKMNFASPIELIFLFLQTP